EAARPHAPSRRLRRPSLRPGPSSDGGHHAADRGAPSGGSRAPSREADGGSPRIRLRGRSQPDYGDEEGDDLMLEIRDAPEGQVKLVGRFDAAEAERVDRALRAIRGPLTLDLSELDYISSAGLGVLIEAHKRLAASGHSLTLSNLVPRVRNIFAYAGLDR